MTMNKQYLVSLDPDQGANDVQAIKAELANLDIELVNDLGEVNVLVVQVPGNDALQKIRNIKGVAAVEEIESKSSDHRDLIHAWLRRSPKRKTGPSTANHR